MIETALDVISTACRLDVRPAPHPNGLFKCLAKERTPHEQKTDATKGQSRPRQSSRWRAAGQPRPLTGGNGGSGRPPGSRNALGEAFIADAHADWAKHSKAVLATVRTDRPANYLRVVAHIIPRDVLVQRTASDYDHLTDRELVELVQRDAQLLLQNLDRSEEASSLECPSNA